MSMDDLSTQRALRRMTPAQRARMVTGDLADWHEEGIRRLQRLVDERNEAWAENERLKTQLRDLDALVSRFCAAVGEPIPVDAVAQIERWRAMRRDGA